MPTLSPSSSDNNMATTNSYQHPQFCMTVKIISPPPFQLINANPPSEFISFSLIFFFTTTPPQPPPPSPAPYLQHINANSPSFFSLHPQLQCCDNDQPPFPQPQQWINANTPTPTCPASPQCHPTGHHHQPPGLPNDNNDPSPSPLIMTTSPTMVARVALWHIYLPF